MSEHLPSLAERHGGEPDALLVFDAVTGRLTFANAAATALFALGTPLPALRASEIAPELADLGARTFALQLPATGAAAHVTVEALAPVAGAVAPSAAVTIRSVARQLPRDRSSRLESLWSLVVRRGLDGTEQIRALLRDGIRGLAVDEAVLARVDGDEAALEFAEPPGIAPQRAPLAGSPAAAALAGSGTYAVLDARLDPQLSAPAARCVLCVAFRAGEDRYVLTLAAKRERDVPFTDDDWRYVETLAKTLGRAVERRVSDARIERLAYSDSLTALPNRLAVLERLEDAIVDAERLGGRTAVLFLDIDGFKSVNDTIGHRGGDVVLAEVAQRLRNTLRRDEYIGRLGGDEFAIVLPRVGDRPEIESIAQRVAGVLTFPFGVDDYRFSLSASIGVAVYPDDAGARDDLLACADAAMYAAKDDGGSRVRFRDAVGGFEQPPALAAATAFAGEPREAGYLLTYQPILDVHSGRVTAAEALIRRIHPVHGLLAPERGWSIARDEVGRRALDRWVLREAITQARAWAHGGAPIRIDVNLAAFDHREIDGVLEDESLAHDVRRVRVEISPDQFVSEDRVERIGRFVEHCAANGIGFALDGFDGGLGLLSSLSHLPIDAVKLERPLVETLATSRTTRAVVEGTIIVAKSLSWSVIAKGVETAAQQDALVALGCDGIQGFYVAHPMTAADFGTWLRDRNRLLSREA